jgi:hypothetical protein
MESLIPTSIDAVESLALGHIIQAFGIPSLCAFQMHSRCQMELPF